MKIFEGKQRGEIVGVVLGNLVPLVGVLMFGWSLAGVVLVYWWENVVIGVVNVLKLLTNRGGMGGRSVVGKDAQDDRGFYPSPPVEEKAAGGGKAFSAIFFTVHYGIFAGVHLMFLEGVFLKKTGGAEVMLRESFGEYRWAILGFLLSHLWVFWSKYLKEGERDQKTISEVMMAPYPRIIVLHFAIVFGAGVTLLLGSPWFFVVLLVALKIGLEVAFAGKELGDFAVGKEKNWYGGS